MRTPLRFILLGGFLIGNIGCQRHEETVATTTAQPAPVRQPYQHDWAKSALDRASEVKRQVADKRKQDEMP